jgi:hypothetical protein
MVDVSFNASGFNADPFRFRSTANDDDELFGTELDVAFDAWRRETIARAPTAKSSSPPEPKKRFEQFDIVMDNMMEQMIRVDRARSVARAAAAAAAARIQANAPLDVQSVPEQPQQLLEQLPIADIEPLPLEAIGANSAGPRMIMPLTRQSPTWVNDCAAPLCHKCRQSFSFWTRRHHCRSCGVVVCGSCSARRLPCVGGGRARVCNDCADAIDEPAPSECIVCMCAPCDTLLLPCAHSNFCMSCATQLSCCALCRGYIRKRQYLFHP